VSGVSITNAARQCSKCGGPRDSDQHYCRACFAAYARARRANLAKEGKRVWTNSRADRPKANGNHFFGPTWLSPHSIPQILATVTASIVWGVCGKMADIPEY
jgi:hypothetical protein